VQRLLVDHGFPHSKLHQQQEQTKCATHEHASVYRLTPDAFERKADIERVEQGREHTNGAMRDDVPQSVNWNGPTECHVETAKECRKNNYGGQQDGPKSNLGKLSAPAEVGRRIECKHGGRAPNATHHEVVVRLVSSPVPTAPSPLRGGRGAGRRARTVAVQVTEANGSAARFHCQIQGVGGCAAPDRSNEPRPWSWRARLLGDL